MRGGKVVTQTSSAPFVPATVSVAQSFTHVTGLLELGFRNIDEIMVVPSYLSYLGSWDYAVFDNLVLTRYAVPKKRRNPQTIDGPAQAVSSRDESDDSAQFPSYLWEHAASNSTTNFATT